MNCQAARFALWPNPKAAASSEAAEALRHLSECPGCQRFFAVQARLGARLKRLAQSQLAPLHTRHAVQAALLAEPLAAVRHRRWSRGRVAVLAGMAAAAAAGLMFVRPPLSTTDRLARPLVAEAMRDMPAESHAGFDHQSLSRWFADRLGHPVFVMEMPGAHLIGGYVTRRIGGVPSPVMRYRADGMEVTYLVVPGGRLMDRTVAAGEVMSLRSRGLEVLIWGEPSGAHVMVAPMPREELKAIAEECVRQMRAA